MRHVAVLMGGWSAERPVSLNSGRGCADALESAGYRVTRIDVDRDIADTLAKLKPDVAFNALHGRGRRGRHDPGRAGDPAHSLHPFRRARLGAGDAEGPRQDRARGGRRAGRARASSSTATRPPRRHALEPPYVLKPVNEGSSFGVVIVKAGSRASAAGGRARGLALRRRAARGKIRRRQGADLRRDGRPRARHHRDRSRFPKRSTATTPSTPKADRGTSFPRT